MDPLVQYFTMLGMSPEAATEAAAKLTGPTRYSVERQVEEATKHPPTGHTKEGRPYHNIPVHRKPTGHTPEGQAYHDIPVFRPPTGTTPEGRPYHDIRVATGRLPTGQTYHDIPVSPKKDKAK